MALNATHPLERVNIEGCGSNGATSFEDAELLLVESL